MHIVSGLATKRENQQAAREKTGEMAKFGGHESGERSGRERLHADSSTGKDQVLALHIFDWEPPAIGTAKSYRVSNVQLMERIRYLAHMLDAAFDICSASG